MNSLIELLNGWGARFIDTAIPLFWQSSLLIVIVLAIDLLLRRKLRPAVRYALWLVVIVKLVLPPSLALPTGAAWWLRQHKSAPPEMQTRILTVTYGGPAQSFTPPSATPLIQLPPPKLSFNAWAMVISGFATILLILYAAARWRKISRCVRITSAPSEHIVKLFAETRRQAHVRRNIAIRVTAEAMSPAVCGLWRPVILLPQALVEKLSPEQLRAVLLHELVHVRRGDVWVNGVQMLLQIVYWWHPLVWLANARVRRAREEAVDDAVMFALNSEAGIYAPTLLEVAKLAFHRPLAGLGIIGILESRTALRHRIERLLNSKTPGRTGLSVMWIIVLTTFTAVAVPMGESQENSSDLDSPLVVAMAELMNANNYKPQPVTADSIKTGQIVFRINQAGVLLRLGKLDDAGRILQNVLSVDPNNQAALYYSSLIKQARDRQAVDATNTHEPNPHRLPNQTLPATNVSVILPGGTNTTDDFFVRTFFSVRTFKLNLNTVSQNLGHINSPADIQPALSNLFQEASVELYPPGSFFFNKFTGDLVVRVRNSDLAMFATIIATLNTSVPEVTIKARFVEVDANNSGIEGIIKKAFMNTTDKTNAWTGILTEQQFAPVREALKKGKGLTLLSEGAVVTLSGRQANLKIANVKTLVTDGNATVTNNQTPYNYKTDAQSFGSSLDVSPTVLADGYTVLMTVTPKITEFLGYDSSQEISKYDQRLKGAQLLKSRVRQTTTSATVSDRQTLVIGNLSDEWVLKGPDRTELRQPYSDKSKKRLLVFITTTIVDRSGNAVHSSDYYDDGSAVHPRDYRDGPSY